MGDGCWCRLREVLTGTSVSLVVYQYQFEHARLTAVVDARGAIMSRRFAHPCDLACGTLNNLPECARLGVERTSTVVTKPDAILNYEDACTRPTAVLQGSHF